MTALTQSRLREVLQYYPSTGVFRWRITRGPKAPEGAKAGTAQNRGYVAIMVDQQLYLAHRLAWLYTHGDWPVGTIDHKNGIRTDNRIRNLRDVSLQANLHNQTAAYQSNKTGLRGVSFEPRSNKWYSRIRVNGKNLMLGYFRTAEEAHAAYVAAKTIHHLTTKDTQ
jgi:hypothetical protein